MRAITLWSPLHSGFRSEHHPLPLILVLWFVTWQSRGPEFRATTSDREVDSGSNKEIADSRGKSTPRVTLNPQAKVVPNTVIEAIQTYH